MPDPQSWQAIGWITVTIFAIAGGINQVMRVVERVKGHPPSGELQLTAGQLAARVTSLEQAREEDRREGSERRAKIYAELKTQREDFQSEIKDVYTRIEHTEREMNNTLRHLPNEIIATLRNTGVIK